MVTEKQMKRQMEKTMSIHIKAHKEMLKLGTMEEEYYGYDHGEHDIDCIIDSIDYGGGGLSFDYYDRMMKAGDSWAHVPIRKRGNTAKGEDDDE